MPLTTDPAVLTTAEALVNQLQAIFGKHPGFRPGQFFVSFSRK